MNVRVLKLAELIKRVLGDFLRQSYLQHDRTSSFAITVTQVRLNASYSHADVFISPLYGFDIDADDLIALMKKNTPRIRYYLGKHAHMKRIPELRFIYDDSFEKAMRTEHLLRSTRKTEA